MKEKSALKSPFYAKNREKILQEAAKKRRSLGMRENRKQGIGPRITHQITGEYRHKASRTERYYRHKDSAIKQLGGKCKKCAIDDYRVLEFDHIDPKTKQYTLSELFYSTNTRLIQKEIEKCQLLCANCHAIKTKENKDNITRGLSTVIFRPQLRTIECERCGKVKQTLHSNTRFCSNRCRKTEEVKRWRDRQLSNSTGGPLENPPKTTLSVT